MITLTDILVATDFSEPSMAALAYGRELARCFRTRLHVVHVVGSMPSAFSGAEAYVVSVPDLQRQIEDTARRELDALPIDDEDVPPIRRVLITSNAPHAAIVEYATEQQVGLIVAGTRGRGAVSHALDRQCRGAHRAHRPVSGTDGAASGEGIRRPRSPGRGRHGHQPSGLRQEHTMSVWLAVPIGAAIIAVFIAAIRRAGRSSVTALRINR